MKLIFIPNDGICTLDEFKINDIDADLNDFGEKDSGGFFEDGYGCANMHFVSKEVSKTILDKYSISVIEYENICYLLIGEFNWGTCGECV